MTTRKVHTVSTRCRCNRCEHEWTVPGEPTKGQRCARCKSRYWNLPRVRKRKAEPPAA